MDIDCFGYTTSTILEPQLGLFDYTDCFGATKFGYWLSHREFGSLFWLHKLRSDLHTTTRLIVSKP